MRRNPREVNDFVLWYYNTTPLRRTAACGKPSTLYDPAMPALATLDRPTALHSHATATLRIAAPLAVALLAQVAMGATDTILLGTLGEAALAAGGLGAMLNITTMVVLQSVLSPIGALVAQAIGAGRTTEVRALYWTSMALAALLTIPALMLLSLAAPLLHLAGEPGALAEDVGTYSDVLRWGVPSVILEMGLMRAFLPAIGAGRLLLYVSLAAALLNGPLCWGLIHGAWGLPALGLRGAALATVVVNTFAAVAIMAALHGPRQHRALVAWARPRADAFRAMLVLGLPSACTAAVESGLFLAAALLVGLLGPAPLAAQQVALNVTVVAFMLPLAIAQAANVRVGLHVGAGDGPGARRAGLVAIGLGGGVEVLAAALNCLVPEQLAALYLGPMETEAFAIAVQLLGVVALFQVADGIQAVALGALRGLGDTQVPFLCAAFGYWAIGFPAAWYLSQRTTLGAAGAWYGLALGLGIVAVLLTARFARRSRQAPAMVLA